MTWWLAGLAGVVLATAACASEPASADDGASEAADLTASHVTVVGVRSRGTRVKAVFDDKVIVKVDGVTVATFNASTHPWFQRNDAATDADHDGVPDVGMLAPGHYHAKLKGTHYGAPKYAISQMNGTAAVPGYRNTDHDDVYSADEIAASERRKDLLTDILVHAGGPGSLPPIGCQVLAPADMNALAKLVGSEFDYVLTDAADGADAATD